MIIRIVSPASRSAPRPIAILATSQAKARTWPEQLRHMSVKEWYLHDTTLRFDPDKDDQANDPVVCRSRRRYRSRRHASHLTFLA